MATAKAYDEYEDAGMAFDSGELEDWDLKAWAEHRVGVLAARRMTFLSAADIRNGAKPWFMQRASKNLLDLCSWYCRAMGLVGPSREDLDTLPPSSSAAGKAIRKQALNLSPDEFVGEWEGEVLEELCHVVTIGRRCSTASAVGWKKHERSLSNKAANCLVRELNAARALKVLLLSEVG